MGDKLRKCRLFTIADFKEEEEWLREMHRAGWKLADVGNPCFFRFERCEPEDVIYQLDFRNRWDGYGAEYRQMFEDCGWEYVDNCMNFHYFRKPVSRMEGEEEIFSDSASRIELLGRIWKWRMIPLFVVFFLCVLPHVQRGLTEHGPMDVVFVLFCVLLAFYIWAFLHVGIRFFRMKRSLGRSSR